MGEIKITITEKTKKVVDKICGDLGILKTELVKSLLINYLLDYNKKEVKKK